MKRLTFGPRLVEMASEMHAFADDLGGWVRGGVRRLSGAERRALAARFAAWAMQDGGLVESDLRHWIQALGEDGREALTEQVAGFCADFEFDLAWLLDGELADCPELTTVMRVLITHYCLACKAALESDDALRRFRRRRVWRHQAEGVSEPAAGASPAAP